MLDSIIAGENRFNENEDVFNNLKKVHEEFYGNPVKEE